MSYHDKLHTCGHRYFGKMKQAHKDYVIFCPTLMPALNAFEMRLVEKKENGNCTKTNTCCAAMNMLQLTLFQPPFTVQETLEQPSKQVNAQLQHICMRTKANLQKSCNFAKHCKKQVLKNQKLPKQLSFI